MDPASSSLPNVLAFCRAYEHASFTLAAKDLRVTPAAVSRAVQRLERSLGTTLFRRTTRAVSPTAKGRAYYEKCAAALALLADAEKAVAPDAGAPRGVVRISVPTTYGLHRLIPDLAGFSRAYPEVVIEVHVSNLNVDFVREGFDLAVRLDAGAGADASLVARKLGDFPLGVFASPAYLKRRGTPRTPDDLASHACALFVMPRTGLALPWLFAAPSRELAVRASFLCVEDPNAGIAIARAGEALFQTFRFMVEGELRRGELAAVLEPFAGRTRKFTLLWSKTEPLSRAARVVADTIIDRARAHA